MSEFWDKNPEAWKFVNSNMKDPVESMREFSLEFEKLKRTAHKIKSSFGMMGMNEPLQIADEIELVDEKKCDQNLLKVKLERLAELVAGSEKELKRELKNLKK